MARGDIEKRGGVNHPDGKQRLLLFAKIKGTRRNRVDIALTTDMLSHAHRDNYDVAILVAGDEDYVPLVEAVKGEGKRVIVWFIQDGLSSALRQSADYFFDLGEILLAPQEQRNYIHM